MEKNKVEDTEKSVQEEDVPVKHPKKKGSIKLSREEHERLQEQASKAEALWDQYLRLQAEFENVQKRFQKEKEDYLRFAHSAIVQELLPIYDHFLIALSNLGETSKEASNHKVILQGVQMIQGELWDLLARNGLTRIETVGTLFNPELHEAMATVEDACHPEGTILEEVRAGYLLHGKLLRPASVKISKHIEEKKSEST